MGVLNGVPARNNSSYSTFCRNSLRPPLASERYSPVLEMPNNPSITPIIVRNTSVPNVSEIGLSSGVFKLEGMAGVLVMVLLWWFNVVVLSHVVDLACQQRAIY
jgi:hypothetical protein